MATDDAVADVVNSAVTRTAIGQWPQWRVAVQLPNQPEFQAYLGTNANLATIIEQACRVSVFQALRYALDQLGALLPTEPDSLYPHTAADNAGYHPTLADLAHEFVPTIGGPNSCSGCHQQKRAAVHMIGGVL